MGEQLFESCQNLKKVVIPASVIDIRPKIFAGCLALTNVNIKALSSTTKIDIPENSWFLNSNPDMTLYVPSAIFTDSESVADQYGPY
jgi:hypothetical protein